MPRQMRSVLAIGASAIAGLAAVVASMDGDADIVPFFVGLTFLGGVGAWAMHEPYEGGRRLLGRSVAVVWLGAATWIGGLLLLFQATCGCSGPTPPPEATYFGLTATLYHLAGLFGGGVLIAVSAFSRRL